MLDTLAGATDSSPSTDSLPSSIQPTKFKACVRQPKSAQRIQTLLPKHSEYPVEVVQNDNVSAVSSSSVILLGCKPYMMKDVLSVSGMREALAGKLLISILAGVTADQMEEVLYGSACLDIEQIRSENRCRVVRAMPNTAAIVRESPSVMDASTALCGSGPAFVALMLESLIDGAVAMGLPRAEAQLMAVQTMRGTTGMVANGEHPALVREKVSTPGGCTMGGLLVLEEGAVRGTIARSVREATVVASLLGSGAKGVNGTRH